MLGPVDIAAIPIGSYEPRWHLHLQHTDPEGAVRMAMQMGVKKCIGVHWGTWLMSDEACRWIPEPSVMPTCCRYCRSIAKVEEVDTDTAPDNQPPIDLEIAKKKLEFPVDKFIVTPAGKTVVL